LGREVPVSGFTIIRSAPGYAYPIGESLSSLMPLVEEVVVVAQRNDPALAVVRGLADERITVVESDWDDGPDVGGRTLARETNRALARCRCRWALYLQADEVLHEADYDAIRTALARHDASERVDALTFRFLHFEGSYGYVNPLRYRRQCRLVRNDGRLQSVRDAAGFGRLDGHRLRTRRSGARVFHYGWAAAPAELKAKTLALARLYHDEEYVSRRWAPVPADAIGSVELAFRWSGRHPAVMRERVARQDWQVSSARRPRFGTPLASVRFYAAWLRKWGLLRRRR